MKEHYDIAVHLPVHGRRRCLHIACKALVRTLGEFAEHGYTSKVFAATERKVDKAILESYGFEVIILPNKPVGRKFNNLARHIIASCDFDWFMEYGSDNVLDPAWTPIVAKAMESWHDQIATGMFYMVELEGRRCKQFMHGLSNIGRMTKAEHVIATMDKFGEVFPTLKNEKLDAGFRRLIKKATRINVLRVENITDRPLLLDIKDAHSMHPFDIYRNCPSVSLEGNFPEYYEVNKSWQQPQAKSGQTASASTSKTAQSTAPMPATPSVTEQPEEEKQGTSLNSSPAPRQAASPRKRKSSKRPRKTTTGSAKSSSEE